MELTKAVSKRKPTPMPLRVYIDVFGRVGFCEQFPDNEEQGPFQEMLYELAVDENLYFDRYEEHEPGFYLAHFEIETDDCGGPDYNVWLQISKLEKINQPEQLEKLLKEASEKVSCS